MKPLYLTTDRLTIRNLAPKDLNDFHCYRSNADVTKYQGFDVMTREQANAFIYQQTHKVFGNPGEWVQYAIVLCKADTLIGDCAIKLDGNDPRMAEVGITISHLHQQKGYAKEAMLRILKFLFEAQNLHRIVETVDAENTASIALMQSLGFRQEGHFIENIFFKGKWGSEIQFAMLKKEWDLLNAHKLY